MVKIKADIITEPKTAASTFFFLIIWIFLSFDLFSVFFDLFLCIYYKYTAGMGEKRRRKNIFKKKDKKRQRLTKFWKGSLGVSLQK